MEAAFSGGSISAYQDQFSKDQCVALIDAARSALNRVVKDVPIAVTDTLISKILHGIFACIPAFDTYFVTGVRRVNKLPRILFFTEEYIEKRQGELQFPTKLNDDLDPLFVWAFNPVINEKIKQLARQLQQITRSNVSHSYPTMRIVDHVFWTFGQYPIK